MYHNYAGDISFNLRIERTGKQPTILGDYWKRDRRFNIFMMAGCVLNASREPTIF